jgi:hypothetical protein
MPQSMSKSQIARFTRICEDQGIRVTRTKKGLLIRFPDGSSTVQHFTNSDSRAVQNQIARFRRAGMTHPNDTRQVKDSLPAYITSGTITPKTRQRIVDYVVSQGYPESVLSAEVVKDLKMDPGWANRALFHTGFRPGPAKNRKLGRPWYTPDDILAMKDGPVTEERDATPEEEAEVLESLASPDSDFVEVDRPEAEEDTSQPIPVEFAPQEVVVERRTFEDIAFGLGEDPGLDDVIAPEPEAAAEPEPQVPEVVHVTQEQAEDIQFIDMRDSWVVDMEELLDEHLYRMVKDRLAVLRVVGIEYEMRVWRK